MMTKTWSSPSYFTQIQPVVYSTFEDGPILQVAEQHGWHVHPAPRTNKFGTPFLKVKLSNTFILAYWQIGVGVGY